MNGGPANGRGSAGKQARALQVILRWLRALGATLYGIGGETSALSADVSEKLRRDEMHQQALVVRREVPIRVLSILLIAFISALYLPAGLVALSYALVLACDRAEAWFFAKACAKPTALTWQKLGVGAVYLGEMFFCLPPAMMWQIDEEFTKAMSVGIMAAALMRLSSIRSVYPLTGFAGIAAQASVIAVANSYYWLHRASYGGFGLTSLIAVAALGYVASTILQNHHQIRQSAISRLVAVQASVAKTYFLAQMSHELRTPLNAILGLGFAAHLSATSQKDKDRLAVLVRSARGLSRVLDDVLDIAAVEEGRINIRPRAADVRQEISSAVSLFQQVAREAGLDLRTEFSADLPGRISLDFDRLRQCLSNLLSNAMKHTTAGHVVVSTVFNPPGQLEIQVRDTGPGIPAGRESAIFDRFARPTTAKDGYGLGLSICRAIIQQMQGEMTLLPSQTGAVFRIRLPVEVVLDQTPAAPQVMQAAGRDRSNLRGKLVLVVDDIATNRLVAVTYLHILGCRTLEAEGGMAALRLLQTTPDVDLVLLDIEMPSLGGLETLALIRADEDGRPPLPVVAMTADAAERDRLLYLNAGMDGYVSKPVEIEGLEHELLRVLSR